MARQSRFICQQCGVVAGVCKKVKSKNDWRMVAPYNAGFKIRTVSKIKKNFAMAATLVPWEEKYRLGLDEIDDQHKVLVDILNRIWFSIIHESDNSVVFSLIEDLEKYTLAHFAAEETLLRIIYYPGFADHKKEHQGFIIRVGEEKRRAETTGQLSLDLMYFLRDWLVEHILGSDKHYACFALQAQSPRKTLIGRLFRRFF